MRNIFFIILLFFTVGFSAVNVGTLVEQGAQFDKKVVEIQGEVIGDIMHRKEGSWLNVLTADGNAIGVLCPKDLVNDIKFIGSYKYKGDIVRIQGVFYRFAQGQSGETMITAKNIYRVAPGHKIDHPLYKIKIIAAIVIWILILLLSFSTILRSVRFFSIKFSRLFRR